MCGRFDLVPEIGGELERLLVGAEESSAKGEIFPTEQVPIFTGLPAETSPQGMYWGFPNLRGSGVIINARSETIFEKPLFRAAAETRRCLVPTTGFYEWNRYYGGKEKPKYKFTLPEEEMLYLAGIYGVFPVKGVENPRFVIVTTEANRWMQDFHHRMPVVLRWKEWAQWLAGENCTALFDRSEVELVREQVGFPAQVSFFDGRN